MTEQEKQEKYNLLVFGKSTMTSKEEKKVIESAFNYAHEIRQFEIKLYWQRSLFFWGFFVTFFTAYALLLDSNSKNFVEVFVLVLLSSLGLFTAFAWRYIAIGSKTWQKNWEKHIDFLESEITGKLYKTTIGKPSEFYSVSRITFTFISSMICFWIGLFILSICSAVNFFVGDMKVYNAIMGYVSVLIMPLYSNNPFGFMLIFGLLIAVPAFAGIHYLKNKWRTNFGKEPTREKTAGNKLTLRHRESPDVHYVIEAHKNGQ